MGCKETEGAHEIARKGCHPARKAERAPPRVSRNHRRPRVRTAITAVTAHIPSSQHAQPTSPPAQQSSHHTAHPRAPEPRTRQSRGKARQSKGKGKRRQKTEHKAQSTKQATPPGAQDPHRGVSNQERTRCSASRAAVAHHQSPPQAGLRERPTPGSSLHGITGPERLTASLPTGRFEQRPPCWWPHPLLRSHLGARHRSPPLAQGSCADGGG